MPQRDEPNPTLARRRLAVRLNRLREQHGRSLDELATFLDVALPQASRLDTGARGFPAEQVHKLADWYGVDPAERTVLLDLVAESRQRGWWQKERLADSYRTLIGLEQAAVTINEYGAWVVPGLLQTPDYARASAVGDDFTTGSTSDEVTNAVTVRVRRQRVLDREPPPALNVVIDEGALARMIGGKAVMSGQLAHLDAMSTRPGITIRVITFEVGAYPGGSLGHYVLLELGEGIPDVLYQEGGSKPVDTADPRLVGEYRVLWRKVQDRALDPHASRALIRWYRARVEPR